MPHSRPNAALIAARRTVRELDPGLSIFGDGPLRRVLALPLLPVRAAVWQPSRRAIASNPSALLRER
jgi:hypothetical protein